MKRLKEQTDSADPELARAANLLARVDPLPESPARMRRIWRALDRRSQGGRFGALRPVGVFAMVLGIAASAGATYGVGQLLVQQFASEPEASPSVAPQASQTTQRTTTFQRPKTDIAGESKTESTPRAASETGTEGPSIEPGPPPKRVSNPRAQSSGRGRRDQPNTDHTSEALVVQQGLEALRTEQDPGKAARLLDSYRANNPDGALAEEALALSIEAATASGNHKRTRALAREYLARYPHGRFQQAAQRALAKSKER